MSLRDLFKHEPARAFEVKMSIRALAFKPGDPAGSKRLTFVSHHVVSPEEAVLRGVAAVRRRYGGSQMYAVDIRNVREI